MESIANQFFNNWQRKLAALIIAAIIWVFVSYSITSTKTISSVPIRIINLPVNKTIQGLLPNGFLSRRVTLNITGTKDIIEQLEPGDLEVVLDVSNQPSEWIVQIAKKNLVSLNPNVNLLHHISSVTNPEFVLKMSSLLTEKIPINIHHPIGNAPEGYEYLDIWPIKLTQTVTGPQEQVLNLKTTGIDLVFNLDDVTKQQLDDLKNSNQDMYSDEVSFFPPEQWKKITITPLSTAPEPLNDPEAANLHLNFLRKEYLPIKGDIPIRIFYPLKWSSQLNPNTAPIAHNAVVKFENDIPILKTPLFAYNVSKLFLDIINESLEIDIVATPKTEREILEWDVTFVDDLHLEDTYVAFLLGTLNQMTGTLAHERENILRRRFRNYMQQFALYLSPGEPLEIHSTIQDDGKVNVQVEKWVKTDAG